MKSYEITDKCITCGRCEENCPKHCIYPGADHYEIDQKQCVKCGTCWTVCPMNAIAVSE